jgi:peptidoglycan hydrolase-like protein with peptidoglycan-binding domain
MLAFRGVGAQDAPGAKKTTISASKAKTATHRKSSKTVATKSAPSQTPTSKSATKTAASITTNNATRRRTTKSSKKPPVAASRRYAQQQPTPQRYKEIQQTLADRGYFSRVPDGTWGPESMEALKRFQRDQNLTEDGKIGSLSLIALGLGPKRAAQEPTLEKTQQP